MLDHLLLRTADQRHLAADARRACSTSCSTSSTPTTAPRAPTSRCCCAASGSRSRATGRRRLARHRRGPRPAARPDHPGGDLGDAGRQGRPGGDARLRPHRVRRGRSTPTRWSPSRGSALDEWVGDARLEAVDARVAARRRPTRSTRVEPRSPRVDAAADDVDARSLADACSRRSSSDGHARAVRRRSTSDCCSTWSQRHPLIQRARSTAPRRGRPRRPRRRAAPGLAVDATATRDRAPTRASLPAHVVLARAQPRARRRRAARRSSVEAAPVGARAHPHRPGRRADRAVPLVRRRRRRTGDDGDRRDDGRRSRRSTAGTAAAPGGASRSRRSGTDLDGDRRRRSARDHAAQDEPVPGADLTRRAEARGSLAATTASTGLRWFSRAPTASSSTLSPDRRRRRARRLRAAGAHLTGDDADERRPSDDICPACGTSRRHPLPRQSRSPPCCRSSLSTLFGDARPRRRARRRRSSSPTACRTPRTAPASCRAARTASPCARAARGRRRRARRRSTSSSTRVMPAPATTRSLRYRLLPPDFADRDEFARVLAGRRPCAQVPPRRRARACKRRLLFDAVLEFGLQSRIGRTLELTGSVAAEVDAGDRQARCSPRPHGARRQPADGSSTASTGELRPTRVVALGARRAGADARPRRDRARVVRPVRREGRQPLARSGAAGRARGHARLPDRAAPRPAFPRVGGTRLTGDAEALDPVTVAAELVRPVDGARRSASAAARRRRLARLLLARSPRRRCSSTSTDRGGRQVFAICRRRRSSSARPTSTTLDARATPARLRRLPEPRAGHARPSSTSSTARRAWWPAAPAGSQPARRRPTTSTAGCTPRPTCSASSRASTPACSTTRPGSRTRTAFKGRRRPTRRRPTCWSPRRPWRWASTSATCPR